MLFCEDAAHSAQVRKADGRAGRFVLVPRGPRGSGQESQPGRGSGSVELTLRHPVPGQTAVERVWQESLKTWESWELLVGFQ